MAPIKVVVTGASGRMAKEVLWALCGDPEMEPCGALSRKASEDYLSLPDGSGLIPFAKDLDNLLTRTRPQVVVDFTDAAVAMDHVRTAFAHGVRPVVGTTGLSTMDLAEIEELSRQRGLGAVVAPNFALGAVLLIHLAKVAAPYFDYAEIIERHHEQKADAPSGTALATARAMLQARGRPFTQSPVSREPLAGTRGGTEGGIALHAVRLPGLVAHQEVIFGGLGQTLTLRHDTISRASFMPGVLMAIKEVVKRNDFVYGLDALLGL